MATERKSVAAAPVPLEKYVQQFDELFGKLSQREEIRRNFQEILLLAERNKTLLGSLDPEKRLFRICRACKGKKIMRALAEDEVHSFNG